MSRVQYFTGSSLFASSVLLTVCGGLTKNLPTRSLAGFIQKAVRSALRSVGLSDIDWEDLDGQHSFLEQVGGDEALDWVKSRNAHCIATLGNPESTALYEIALGILNSKDKIPYVSKIGDFYYNFWQDENNQRGLWRRTTLLQYKSPLTKWETVLDVDELGKKEGMSWVYKGYTLYDPDDEDDAMKNRRVLLQLSNGGADATVVREFDLVTKDFVLAENGGFVLPEAKSRVSWKDENTLLVGTDMKSQGKDTVTNSGYPRIVFEWVRGTPLSEAKPVFEGEKADVSVSGYVSKHRGYRVEVRHRALTFYTSKKWVNVKGYYDRRLAPVEDDWTELPIQDDASASFFADQTLISLRSDWSIGEGTLAHNFKAGSLLAVRTTDLVLNRSRASFTLLFAPTDRVSLDSYTRTRNFLIIHTLENVKSRLHFWSYAKSKEDRNKPAALQECKWSFVGSEAEAVIRGAYVDDVDSDENDFYWITTSSFTRPSTLCLGNATLGPAGVAQAKAMKSLPPQFKSEGLVELQYEATSKDGTKIPYFIVRNDGAASGPIPTLLYGYGGFEISLTPAYAALVGCGWLERGGCYVVANIRGGGEFGPAWHKAALKENRQLAYDDFIAVAEDLIARGITIPDRLGIRGGSNGGLLMGNMIVQRPDLFGAVCCAVPLLDMKIYNRLLAGNSWMAEYGNPDTDDWKFLKKYSAYHNIDPLKARNYPPLLMTTSTRDDRVHPYHARCFVKRLLDIHEVSVSEKSNSKKEASCEVTDNAHHDEKSKGFVRGSVYYYENIEGGHGGAADNKQQAFMNALYLDFLWKTIGKN